MSILRAKEGTYPKTTLITATMSANAITTITKIVIKDLSALGGVRSMSVIWEQALDKTDSAFEAFLPSFSLIIMDSILSVAIHRRGDLF